MIKFFSLIFLFTLSTAFAVPQYTPEERHAILSDLHGFYDNANAKDGKGARIIPAIQMIYGATHSIDIEIYELEDTNVIAALDDAADRGVQIRIVKDPRPVPKADQCLWFSPPNPKEMPSCALVRKLIAKVNKDPNHPQIVQFNKDKIDPKIGNANLCGKDDSPFAGQCFQHGKIIIADSKEKSLRKALISTGNLNGSNLCDHDVHPSVCNRDFSFITADAAEIEKLEHVFKNDHDQYGPLTQHLGLKTIAMNESPSITVSPYSLNPIVDFINTAQAGSTLQIENQYLKEPNMNAALIAAAKRGVNVQMMVASLCAFSKPTESDKIKFTKLFKPFEDAGVKIKIFTNKFKVDGSPGYLHAKAIVIGTKAWIGSVNGSDASLNQNREYGKFFETATDVRKLSKILAADFKNPAAETWQDSLICKERSGGQTDPTSDTPPQE